MPCPVGIAFSLDEPEALLQGSQRFVGCLTELLVENRCAIVLQAFDKLSRLPVQYGPTRNCMENGSRWMDFGILGIGSMRPLFGRLEALHVAASIPEDMKSAEFSDADFANGRCESRGLA